MTVSAQNSTLSIGQLHILEMLNRCETEESLDKLKKILFDYYAKAAEDEANRLWDEGLVDSNKIEEWGNEHLRTQYIHAK